MSQQPDLGRKIQDAGQAITGCGCLLMTVGGILAVIIVLILAA